MSEPTEELIGFESASGEISPGDLRASRAQGGQRISELYEYRVSLETSLDGGLSPEAVEDLLRNPCRLEIGAVEGQSSGEVHGILREVELAPMNGPTDARYEAVLVPTLWRTTLAFTSRVFQDQSVDQIVTAVLEEHGVAHELRLDGSYPAREYVVQYQESDFAFLSRQLEHWGLFYFFEQGPDGEVVVVGDSNRAFGQLPDYETIPYFSESGGRAARGGHVIALGRTHRVRPERVELHDYNYRTPSLRPTGEAEVDASTGHGTRRVYGEHFADDAEGKTLAAVRAEQLAADREVYRGRTDLRALAPGHRFELSGYPVGDLDQEYVVVSIQERSGEAGSGYQCTFEAIPYSVPYRTPCRTEKPRIQGFMHAIVDGETPGMAAPIDAQGRYKLVMPYDAVGQPGGQASRWVRMSQTSSGPDYGFHFPLHIGIEVAVAHLDGDPDRPVIVGATPNPETASPVTSADATKSRIKTKAGILMEFEDAG